MIIVKSLIFICGLPAEKTKRKGIAPFSFKSIILQPGEIARESVLGVGRDKSTNMWLEREAVQFLQDKNVPFLICKMSMRLSLIVYLFPSKIVLFKESPGLRCNSIMTANRGHLL